MKTLIVKKFSCIADATLDISSITLLIGPQASGKSVLCKLSYFFANLLAEQIRAIVEKTPHAEYLHQIKLRFLRWFPYETWGSQKFELAFMLGSCRIDISRTVSKGKGGKGINIRFDPLLIEHYKRSLAKVEEKSVKRPGDAAEFSYVYWSVERLVRDDLKKTVGEDFVDFQLFIPAARSFFTSVGRAIAAFENGNILDPLTLLFGKVYSARDEHYFSESADDRAIQALLRDAMRSMLGGDLVKERDREVLRTSDGRTIPLGALSSGQQELFPLLRVLPSSVPKAYRRLLYVEEPEAHLFPDAQSRLVELLAALANLYATTVEMVITTHSPYVLTKFNNLITAGHAGKRRSRAAQVANVVPQRSWISGGMVKAYALDGGRLHDLIDSDGLIDGGYLDEVSNKIGYEYTRLLDVEFEAPKAVHARSHASE